MEIKQDKVGQSSKPTPLVSIATPLVSIVTVVFNGEKYLQKAMDSIFRQTYQNIEYIVIDGDSKDGTVELIRKNERQIDFWISEKDLGIYDAMNKSLMYCNGEYVMFMHSDDILENFAVSKLMEGIMHANGHWATGFYKYINSSENVTRLDNIKNNFTFFDMILRNVIRHQATIVPLSYFKDIKFEKYKYAMDYMFFLKVWRKYGGPIIIQEHLAGFRLHGSNLSSNFYASLKDEMLVRKHYRRLNKESYKLIFDYLIYFIRKCKIYLYHSWRQNVG